MNHKPGEAEEVPPEPITDDDRALAMLCWLIDIALHVIGPWALWRLSRRSAYLDHHAKTCANHTLTVLMLILAACVVFGAIGWMCLLLEQNLTGIIVLCVLLLGVAGLAAFSLVVHVVGALKARAGVYFTPPLCRRFVK